MSSDIHHINHIRILFSEYLSVSYVDHTRCTQIVYSDMKHITNGALYVYHNQLSLTHQKLRPALPRSHAVLIICARVIEDLWHISKHSVTAAAREQAAFDCWPHCLKQFTWQLSFKYHTRANVNMKDTLKVNKYFVWLSTVQLLFKYVLHIYYSRNSSGLVDGCQIFFFLAPTSPTRRYHLHGDGFRNRCTFSATNFICRRVLFLQISYISFIAPIFQKHSLVNLSCQ